MDVGRTCRTSVMYFFSAPAIAPPPPLGGVFSSCAFALRGYTPRETLVRWYVAPKGAKAFPGGSIWGGSDFLSDYERATVVNGENPYREGTRWSNGATPTGAQGKDFCGNLIDFLQPQPWDPLRPGIPRAANGLALCCNQLLAGALVEEVQPLPMPTGAIVVSSFSAPLGSVVVGAFALVKGRLKVLAPPQVRGKFVIAGPSVALGATIFLSPGVYGGNLLLHSPILVGGLVELAGPDSPRGALELGSTIFAGGRVELESITVAGGRVELGLTDVAGGRVELAGPDSSRGSFEVSSPGAHLGALEVLSRTVAGGRVELAFRRAYSGLWIASRPPAERGNVKAASTPISHGNAKMSGARAWRGSEKLTWYPAAVGGVKMKGSGNQAGISIVQNVTPASNTGTSVSLSWPNPTTAGNCLLMGISSRTTVNGPNSPVYTVPSGWTVGPTFNQGSGSIACNCVWYYILNASSRSGSESVTLLDSRTNDLYLFELGGLVSGGTRDGSNHNNGFNSTTLTSGSIVTGTANEIIFALFGSTPVSGTTTFSTPTNTFTIQQSKAASPGGSCASSRIVSSTGTYSTGVTASGALNQWVGVIISFK